MAGPITLTTPPVPSKTIINYISGLVIYNTPIINVPALGLLSAASSRCPTPGVPHPVSAKAHRAGWSPGTLSAPVPVPGGQVVTVLRVSVLVWLFSALYAGPGSRMTHPVPSTPVWAPVVMNGAPDPGEPATLKSKGSRLLLPVPAPVSAVTGWRNRLRFRPSCLLLWLEVDPTGKINSSTPGRGTPTKNLYDHSYAPAWSVFPMAEPAAGSTSIIATLTGIPGIIRSHLAEIPISLQWCRDQDPEKRRGCRATGAVISVLELRLWYPHKLAFHNGY